MITQSELKDLLRYDEQTGEFFWLIGGRRRHMDRPAGTNDKDGYRIIRVHSRGYKASRLAWLYVYGEWPDRDLDHKNRDKQDNRIDNLRPATGSQNKGNTVAKSLGVRWRNWGWEATLRDRYLGVFPTQEEAKWAYMRAHAEVYGEFSPHRTMFT